MAIVYSSDIGIAGCIRRASDSLYLPRMSTDLKEYISKYDICLAHRCTQGDEPNMYNTNSWHDPIPSLELICTNLTTVQSKSYNRVFMSWHHVTSRSAITGLKAIFSLYGILDILVTENGPQFLSAEFAVFEKAWMFQRTISSSHYRQCIDKAENAIKTVKRLFTKCKESRHSEFIALLDWRKPDTQQQRRHAQRWAENSISSSSTINTRNLSSLSSQEEQCEWSCQAWKNAALQAFA